MNLCDISNRTVKVRLILLLANGPVSELKVQLDYCTFKLNTILVGFNEVPMHVIYRDWAHMEHCHNLQA